MMIPIDSITRRMANHCDALDDAIAELPWWAWKRRLMLRGARAAYRYETIEHEIFGYRGNCDRYESPDRPA